MTRCRLAAIHFAIVAMLLRALVPAGWMPDPAGAAAFTICALDGSGHHSEAPAKPGQEDGRHIHDECPCATAPHVTAPVLAAHFFAPELTGRSIANLDHAEIPGQIPDYQPHSPRAPPRIA
jgi:hypothetical protein